MPGAKGFAFLRGTRRQRSPVDESRGAPPPVAGEGSEASLGSEMRGVGEVGKGPETAFLAARAHRQRSAGNASLKRNSADVGTRVRGRSGWGGVSSG